MKNKEENEEEADREMMRCQIGIRSKAHNVIYNPAMFKQLFFQINSALLVFRNAGVEALN